MTSENVKQAVDHFGRLSFVLESYVKLAQTGDHKEIAKALLYASYEDASRLKDQLWDLCMVERAVPTLSEDEV